MAAHSKAQLPPSPQFQLSFLQAGTSLGFPKVGDALSTEHPGPDPIIELIMKPDLSFFLNGTIAHGCQEQCLLFY